MLTVVLLDEAVSINPATNNIYLRDQNKNEVPRFIYIKK